MRPKREHVTHNQQTYMVTTSTWERRVLFRNERWARLLLDTLYRYRGSAYLLHEFVIMPDHFHVLLTPLTTLEKAVQFTKGGFSYRAKKELGSNMEVWQKGFQDHRIRDAGDYDVHRTYILENPVTEHLCEKAEEYPYTSVAGAPEGAPFQSKATACQSGDASRQSSVINVNYDNSNKRETNSFPATDVKNKIA